MRTLEQLLNTIKEARETKNFKIEMDAVMDIQINYGYSVKEINSLVK